jgi:2-C-methyl-D-erythritol 4-phosphate cytidylyltransferase/2-C-methyl-D-erythritol 2,4-cyclodiphosphate synthase
MHVTAIIAAGGRGRRFGGELAKQLVAFGSRSALERSVSVFAEHPEIDEIVVALPDDIAADPPPYLTSAAKRLVVVRGGVRRQDSVANALRAASPTADIVVVHDAVRPFVTPALISRTIAAAAESGAAIAAVPARDTVKRTGPRRRKPPAEGTDADDRPAVVAETLPRESVFLAQTPQAFRRSVLTDALALADADVTDEASLVERTGHEVRIVPGEPRNIKITTPEDMLLAESMAREEDSEDRDATSSRRRPAATRIGVGYDVHRLVEGRPLVLGGVTIPFERGLLGHSDADAVAHAVTDAVLGAAAISDIGRLFPDTDPQWRGASSLDLLARAMAFVRERKFAVVNVDVVIVAEQPKVGPFIDAMRRGLAGALGIQMEDVGIKGKTNEGLGDVGRGAAIAVHAVALLERRV